MNPSDLPAQPAAHNEQTPAAPAVAQPASPELQKQRSHRTTLALWLMIGPTALLMLAFIARLAVNFFLSDALITETEGRLFGEPTAVSIATNIILWLANIIGFIAWLPGLIVGIVLLATKK